MVCEANRSLNTSRPVKAAAQAIQQPTQPAAPVEGTSTQEVSVVRLCCLFNRTSATEDEDFQSKRVYYCATKIADIGEAANLARNIKYLVITPYQSPTFWLFEHSEAPPELSDEAYHEKRRTAMFEYPHTGFESFLHQEAHYEARCGVYEMKSLEMESHEAFIAWRRGVMSCREFRRKNVLLCSYLDKETRKKKPLCRCEVIFKKSLVMTELLIKIASKAEAKNETRLELVAALRLIDIPGKNRRISPLLLPANGQVKMSDLSIEALLHQLVQPKPTNSRLESLSRQDPYLEKVSVTFAISLGKRLDKIKASLAKARARKRLLDAVFDMLKALKRFSQDKEEVEVVEEERLPQNLSRPALENEIKSVTDTIRKLTPLLKLHEDAMRYFTTSFQ